MNKTLSLILLLLTSTIEADVVIIVNQQCQLTEITKKAVIDLYMGKTSKLPNGQTVQTIDAFTGSELRRDFYKRLTGKSEAQIDAYWAQLAFAGRLTPPPQRESVEEILDMVATNPELIAYVDHRHLNDKVKVLLTLK